MAEASEETLKRINFDVDTIMIHSEVMMETMIDLVDQMKEMNQHLRALTSSGRIGLDSLIDVLNDIYRNTFK